MKRIFIAVKAEEKERKKILEFQELIKDDFPFKSVRWVDFENLHITIVFLGVMRDENVEKLRNDLKKIKFENFQIEFNKVEYFPTKKEAKLIWIRSQNEQILKLKEEIDQVLVASKAVIYSPENDFLTHITIGRINSFNYRKMPLEQIPFLEDLELSFEVNSFFLAESKLSKNGIKYIEIEKYDF